jgi:hypothetical protein
MTISETTSDEEALDRLTIQEALAEEGPDEPETDSRWKQLLDRFALYLTGRRGSSPGGLKLHK